MQSALLIIDVQNYFMNHYTSQLPKKIADFITRSSYDHILFTKFVNRPDSNFVKQLGWGRCSTSPDTDISAPLSSFANKKNVFEKHTFSAFKSKKLLSYLKNNTITALHICGTDSEACVLSSAFEAFDLGFTVKILKDLCASTKGERYHELAKTIIEQNLEANRPSIRKSAIHFSIF